MRCMRCGAELRPDAKFCGVCGQVLGGGSSGSGGYSQNTGNYQPQGSYPQDTGNYQPQGSYQNTGNYPPADDGYGSGSGGIFGNLRNQAGGYLANRAKEWAIQEAQKASRANRMPQGVALGSDERIVKNYRIGRYSFKQGAIDVIVTNKRVIRFEDSSLFGMKNNRIDEINIDAVHGVSTDMKRALSPFGFIISLILFIVAIGALVAGLSALTFIGALALCALALFLSLRPKLEFKIHGSVGGDALMNRVNSRALAIRSAGVGAVFQFKPTPETTVMLKEIGALLYDLKTLGDAAISRWT